MEDIFSKHFNRLHNDLKKIQGYDPLMKVVLSNTFRQLEEDIMDELGENENEEKSY
jgi:hypothetical protein